MQVAQFILEIVKIAIWPSALMLAIIVFRGSIPKLLERVKGAELPGTRLEFFEKEREIEQLTEAATGSIQRGDDTAESTNNEDADANAVSEASQKGRALRNIRMMERKREAGTPEGGWVVDRELGGALSGPAFASLHEIRNPLVLAGQAIARTNRESMAFRGGEDDFLDLALGVSTTGIPPVPDLWELLERDIPPSLIGRRTRDLVSRYLNEVGKIFDIHSSPRMVAPNISAKFHSPSWQLISEAILTLWDMTLDVEDGADRKTLYALLSSANDTIEAVDTLTRELVEFAMRVQTKVEARSISNPPSEVENTPADAQEVGPKGHEEFGRFAHNPND
ncbi:hypothetical protein AB0O34_20145 [Sphaerisporangium sp. NPDC088356]|uniref:hypothetical protein n=1 Tax=Sphaerisporangium sp. NPDC088356 TaxID=3154871 RepID=UPI00341C4348